MILYHYCSVDSFKNILKSKVLWLTDFTKSNDEAEIKQTFCNIWNRVRNRLLESYDLDKNIVLKIVDIIDHEFEYQYKIQLPLGICFTSKNDLLHHWLEYGDSTEGVCLGFEFDWFNNIPIQMPGPSSLLSHAIGCHKVLYDSEEIENYMFEVCYESISKYDITAWIEGIMPTFRHLSPFIKNHTFDIEQEIRIVYYPVEYKDISNNLLGLTKVIEEPKKHVCLPWSDKNGNHALKQIIIGHNCELTYSKIEKLLKESGLTGTVEVYSSETSYRKKQ